MPVDLNAAPENGKPSPGFAKAPDYRVGFEPTPRRLRVEFNGEILADTLDGRVLLETKHVPVYYFPQADVHMELLTPTDLTTFCPFKGEASYWTLSAGGRTAENAVWSYTDPYAETRAIRDYLGFYWNKMDHWYEEDEEIFVHPRDPYKRIDAVPSSRPGKVILGGEVVAESTGAHFLFETGMPVRYYIPPEDVNFDLLSATDTSSRCPYKGIASYWSAEIGAETFGDIAWSYAEPIAECPKIKGLVCFFNENVDDIQVDGVSIDRATTQWSSRFLAETLDGPEHIV